MAERTISTRLAITGEDRYRETMRAINDSLKTLQSDLRKTDSDMRTQGSTTELLRQKQEKLGEISQQQARKIEELRAALENAQKSEKDWADKVEASRARLEKSREALERFRASGLVSAETEKRLTEEVAKNERELQTNEAGLAAAERGINAWQRQLNAAEIQLNNTTAELRENGKALEESAEGAEKNAEALDALAANLAAGGIGGGLERIRAALEACTAASTEFEQAMSGVFAIAGASEGEMEALTEKAQEIGASTMFTATQAAEALQYMALAGWNAEEMLSGVDGVINLAAASGENLGAVSDIVTDALTAFGLSASDAGHFVDVLAQASARSNTTVTMLGEAFKYAAPVAGALGYSVEDVAVAMGLMANNGIKGSMAGTAMRQTFTSLNGVIELTGRSFGTVEYSAQNADGTMKSLSETIDDLRGYFERMTDTERTANAQAIAGERAYAGLLAILNASASDYESLAAAISDCGGAAERMADVRMDNLQGQATLMRSAFDALKVAVGDELNPALRELAETGTDALAWAGEFVEAHEGLVPLIAAAAAGLTVLGGTVAAVVAAKKIAIPVMQLFNTVMGMNPALVVATAIVTLTAVIGTLALTAREAESPIRDVQNAVRDMRSSFEEADEAFRTTSGEAQAAAGLAGAYLDRLAGLEAQGTLTAEQQSEYNATLALLKELLPDVNFELDETTGLLTDGAEAARALVDNWREMAVAAAMQEQLKAKAEALVSAQVALNEAEKRQSELEARRIELETEEAEAVRLRDEAAAQTGAHAGAAAYDAANAAYAYGQALLDTRVKLEENKEEQDAATDAVDEARKAVEEAQAEVDALAGAYAELTEAESKNTDAASAAAEEQERLTATVAELREGVAELGEAFGEEYKAAYSSLASQIGLTERFTNEIDRAKESGGEMMRIWEDNAEALEDYAGNLTRLSEAGLRGSLIAALSEDPGQLARIVEGIENEIYTVDELNAAWEAQEAAAREAALAQALAVTDLGQKLEELRETAGSEGAEALLEDTRALLEEYGLTLEDLGLEWDAFGERAGEALSGIPPEAERAEEAVRGVSEAADEAAEKAGEKMPMAVRRAEEAAQTVSESAKDASEAAEAAADGVGEAAETMTGAAEEAAAEAAASTDEAITAAADAEKAWREAEENVNARLAELRQTLETEGAAIRASAARLGADIVNGMIAGIDSRAGALYARMRAVVNEAILAAKAAAESNSPSKRTIRLFEDVDEGMIVGAENRKEDVARAVRGVVDAALDIGTPKVEINEPPIYTTASLMLERGAADDGAQALAAELREIREALAVVAGAVTGPRSVELEDGTIVARYTKKINRALGMARR